MSKTAFNGDARRPRRQFRAILVEINDREYLVPFMTLVCDSNICVIPDLFRTYSDVRALRLVSIIKHTFYERPLSSHDRSSYRFSNASGSSQDDDSIIIERLSFQFHI